jgi:hypothetical protein
MTTADLVEVRPHPPSLVFVQIRIRPARGDTLLRGAVAPECHEPLDAVVGALDSLEGEQRPKAIPKAGLDAPIHAPSLTLVIPTGGESGT